MPPKKVLQPMPSQKIMFWRTAANSLQQSEEFFVWKIGFMRVLTGLIGF